MTLVVQKPSGAKLVMRQTWAPADTDAAAYIAAVEAADGQALEERTRKAIDDFVLGCKADGIWTAIKASCILAGARTLSGALVPLVGTAPTNVGPFVSGDYNRKTGLVGNGSTKYLDSNRPSNSDPQNSSHLAIYATTVNTSTRYYAGANDNANGATTIYSVGGADLNYKSRNITNIRISNLNTPGLIGISRSSSASFVSRDGGRSTQRTQDSQTPVANNSGIFQSIGAGLLPGDGRLAFYSIGESLDLTLLDARVTQLITTFAAVIP
jgi:hypothetical protein